MWLEPKSDLNIYKEEKTAYGKQVSFETGVERPLSGFVLYGKSTQVTTTGAQLFDPNAKFNTNNDVTFEVLDNGKELVITTDLKDLGGEKTYRNITFDLNGLIGKTVTISCSECDLISGEKDACDIHFKKKDGKTEYHTCSNNGIKTVIIPEDAMGCWFRLLVIEQNNTSIKPGNYTVRLRNVMLNEGLKALPFEPYTGGKPSPSPEYPQPIKSVGDDGQIVVDIAGRNIIKADAASFTVDGWQSKIKNIENGIRCISNNGWGLFLLNSKNLEGKTVTLTFTYKQIQDLTTSEPTDNSFCVINSNTSVYPNSKTIMFKSDNPNTTDTTISSTFVAKKYFGFFTRVSKENVGLVRVIDITNICVELGGNSTGYEPYVEPQILTLKTPNGLPGIPVNEGGNYMDVNGQQWICDEIDLGRGKYIQRIEKIILDGSEPWEMRINNNTKRTFFVINIKESMKDTGILCSHFRWEAWGYNSEGGNDTVSFMSDWKSFTISTNRFSDVEQLKQFLSKNNTTVYYILETPVETPLSPEEIFSYKALHTYSPTTVMENDAESWMRVEYYTAYMETKTNWKSSDFFNIQDYNRIKGNLNQIRKLALTLWPEFSFEDMGEDKSYEDYSFYADEINRFEANVDHICQGTFPFQVGERQTFYDNTPFIGWQELNRLEEACRMMYSNIKSREQGRRRLPFLLNGGVL